MMAADYRHIGGRENRLGRHYSRFSGFWLMPSLQSNHLLCENRRTAGRIGEDGLAPGVGFFSVEASPVPRNWRRRDRRCYRRGRLALFWRARRRIKARWRAGRNRDGFWTKFFPRSAPLWLETSKILDAHT